MYISNNQAAYIHSLEQSSSNIQIKEKQNVNDIETLILNQDDSIQISGIGMSLGALAEGRELFQMQSGIPKALTEEEQQQESEIHKKIDDIMSKYFKPPSEDEQKELADIFSKIDAIFADGEVTADESKQLNALTRKLDESHSGGVDLESMSEEDKKALDELFASLDKLYGFDQLKKEDVDSINNTMKMIDELLAKLEKQIDESQNSYK